LIEKSENAFVRGQARTKFRCDIIKKPIIYNKIRTIYILSLAVPRVIKKKMKLLKPF